jgi:heterodisulfide reductase subunit A
MANDAVMVIGGGIAGIEAALNLADYGARVYLVESSPSIGGMMARLDKTFPTNDCSICIEAPKMYEVQRHPNITVLTNCELRRVEEREKTTDATGAPGSSNFRGFKARLVKRPRFVDEARCKGCGKCAEACPLSVPDELDGRLGGLRKLIFVPFPQAVPNCYVVDTRCRYGKLREKGACIGGCIIDCIQCRECPIAECVKACKNEGADAVVLWQREELLELEVKSIIIATGIEAFEPPLGLYGYKVYTNVVTHLEYERLMNAGGPTGGDIKRLSDRAHAARVAWLQCVGRDKRCGIPYCSKICCMNAIKQAIITKEHDANVETYILYTNLKTYGKGFYEFYKRASRELGVKFVKGRPSDVLEDAETKRLRIRYENLDSGKIEVLEADLLVLSTAVLPARANKRLARILRLPLDELGFFKTKDSITAAVETEREGIYVCGGAAAPIDISEAVSQAIAASLRALS